MEQEINLKDVFRNPHLYGTVGDLKKMLYGGNENEH